MQNWNIFRQKLIRGETVEVRAAAIKGRGFINLLNPKQSIGEQNVQATHTKIPVHSMCCTSIFNDQNLPGEGRESGDRIRANCAALS